MIKNGFFNSKNGDRRYDASDMNRPLKTLISNGVIPHNGQALQIFAGDGMKVKVASGMAHVNGHWLENNADEVLNIAESDYVYDRIDRVVIRTDDTENVRDMFIYVKAGHADSKPQPPALINTTGISEICLAEIRIPKQCESISQAYITDTRPDSRVCGWVTALIDKIDTSTLYIQWETAYREQFDEFEKNNGEFIDSFKRQLNELRDRTDKNIGDMLEDASNALNQLRNTTETDLNKLKVNYDKELAALKTKVDGELSTMESETRIILNGLTDRYGKDIADLQKLATDNLNGLKTTTENQLKAIESRISKLQTEVEDSIRIAKEQLEKTKVQQQTLDTTITDLNAKVESGYFTGKQGEKGKDGVDGKNGIDGKNGKDGANGLGLIGTEIIGAGIKNGNLVFICPDGSEPPPYKIVDGMLVHIIEEVV